MEYGQINAVGRNGHVPEIIQTQILEAVSGIRYGAVEIVIHEGRVVQIERKEKVRFERPS